MSHSDRDDSLNDLTPLLGLSSPRTSHFENLHELNLEWMGPAVPEHYSKGLSAPPHLALNGQG